MVFMAYGVNVPQTCAILLSLLSSLSSHGSCAVLLSSEWTPTITGYQPTYPPSGLPNDNSV
ncbi:hypothetical protein AA0113_g9474 [Alternaria arborescens]|uniref:Secreted protein n=1 Tax=Alternaria arborescens TaxID=156630 RepID=A0A4Q4R9A3_9PLEO|nr:hypothetical protein AA0111_g3623 [Alternaria arborescens]RYN34742.1 hypothetical protein AA0112_g5153 [Alternaria arborescens]RYO35019.1 hypothetical protein AA0111_g3623 [Alternaria arborescens]RYO53021.1 hypothetical protein AA0113_g9474 [Alternaria arborescens]